jgi:RNA polymerase sigma factor (sigma-70 family)
MTPRTLEQAFARFRAERDLEALAEVFDRTAPQLLDVARHLARGRGEAEDLVQATFLAALEGAERFEAGRELVPWLLGILAHTARRERERGARREDSALDELAAAASDDPAALAEGVELEAALASALGQVPPTYREVLRSHLAEGQAPEEIARRLGRAPGTVRMQLYRGFRWLRRLLPAGFALGAGAVLAPRGLASVRAEILRAAGAPAGIVPSTLGGMLVAKKLVLVAVVLVLAVSGWWLARGRERAEPPVSLAAVPAPAPLATPVAPELAPIEPAESRVPATDPGASSAPENDEPYGALSVVLTWWDGTPAAGLSLRFYTWAERQPMQAFQLKVTDLEGRARVARIHGGWAVVEVERMRSYGMFQAEVVPGAEREERLTLERHCDVVGRVVDSNGVPAAGAKLWVNEAFFRSASLAEVSHADGSFRVRSVPQGFGLLATAEGGGSSEVVSWDAFEVLDPNTRHVELHLRGESAELEGLVIDGAGDPVGGALVSVQCAADSRGREKRSWPHLRSASPDGSFRFNGLHRGRIVVTVEAPGFALKNERFELEEGRTAQLSIRLDAGFTVRGTVLTREGLPVPAVSISAQSRIPNLDGHRLFTATDGQGRYTLDFVPAGPMVLVATKDETSPGELRAQTRLTGSLGEPLEWNVVFGSGPSIRGRAVDEAGRSLAGWSVKAVPGGGAEATDSMRVVTDDHGAFEIPDLVETAYSVVLCAPEDERRSTPRAVTRNVVPDGPELELVVRGERTPSAYLLGRVLDPDGTPVRPTQMWARRTDDLDSIGAPTWSEGERFRLGPMLAGEYELSLSVEGLPGLVMELRVEEGEEHDLGDLALPHTGNAVLTLRPPEGGSIEQPFTMLLMHGRFGCRLTSTDGLTFESDPLWPGKYTLRVQSGNAAPERPVEIEVRPGETTLAEIRTVAARTLRFDFRVPDGERPPARVRLEVRDSAGALAFGDDRCMARRSDGLNLLRAAATLPFGRFAYSARSEDGWAGDGELEVAAGSETQRVTVSLSR